MNQGEEVTSLRAEVMRELVERYTALPDGYRLYVNEADADSLRRVLDLAMEDAPGREIAAALGMPD